MNILYQKLEEQENFTYLIVYHTESPSELSQNAPHSSNIGTSFSTNRKNKRIIKITKMNNVIFFTYIFINIIVLFLIH